MRSLILKSGWWLTGEAGRRSVSRHLEGTDVIGYVVQGSDAKWRIEGRDDQFDSPTLAADALVRDLKDPSAEASDYGGERKKMRLS